MTKKEIEEYHTTIPVRVKVRKMDHGVQVIIEETVAKVGREFMLKEYGSESEVERNIQRFLAGD